MQIVLEIPDELKGVGEAVQTLLHQVEATWRSTGGGRAMDYAAIEQQLAAGAAAIEQASHQVVLQGLDIDQPRVVIEGQVYSRVGRYEADYYTMAGPVRVTRTLYREQARVTPRQSMRSVCAVGRWAPSGYQGPRRRWPINCSKGPRGRPKRRRAGSGGSPTRGRVLRVWGKKWAGSIRRCARTWRPS